MSEPPSPSDPAGTSSRSKLHLREIAGFELAKLLGEGGMGRVFKARQKSLDRDVALKVLTPKLAGDPEYLERFDREAKAAAKLQHKNIVAVIDRGRDPASDLPYIAFEFVDGRSLEQLAAEKGRLPERDALKITAEVLEALRYASERGLIHRDVKPDNILITHEGVVKLADLGLAKAVDDARNLTQTGMVMGTPHYMAPEQAMGDREVDVRADLYALGLVLYRLLVGELPWSTQESPVTTLSHHINEDCPDPRKARGDLSEDASKVCLGLSARDPAKRYPTPSDALKDVLRILEGGRATGPLFEPAATANPARPEPERRPARTGSSDGGKRISSRREAATVPPPRTTSSRREQPILLPQGAEPRRIGVLVVLALLVAFGIGGLAAALVDRKPLGPIAVAAIQRASAQAWRGPADADSVAAPLGASDEALVVRRTLDLLRNLPAALGADPGARRTATAALEEGASQLVMAGERAPRIARVAQAGAIELEAWRRIATEVGHAIEAVALNGGAHPPRAWPKELEGATAYEVVGRSEGLRGAIDALSSTVTSADASRPPPRVDRSRIAEALHASLVRELAAAAAFADHQTRGEGALAAFSNLPAPLSDTLFVRGRYASLDTAEERMLDGWSISKGLLTPPPALIPGAPATEERHAPLRLDRDALARGAPSELALEATGTPANAWAFVSFGGSAAVLFTFLEPPKIALWKDLDPAQLKNLPRKLRDAFRERKERSPAVDTATFEVLIVKEPDGSAVIVARSGKLESQCKLPAGTFDEGSREEPDPAIELRAANVRFKRVRLAVSKRGSR